MHEYVVKFKKYAMTLGKYTLSNKRNRRERVKPKIPFFASMSCQCSAESKQCFL